MSSSAATGNTEQVPNKTFLIVSITLTCVTGLLVIARLVGNWQRKAKKHFNHLDDYICVAALIFLAASVAGYNELIKALSNPQVTLGYLMRLSHALTWIGSLMLWGCKAPILIVYITIFGVKNWLKITSYTILAVTGTIFLISSSYVTAKCSGHVDAMFLAHCTTATTQIGFTLGLISVITDALIFVLPIPVLLKLQLPTPKKIGLAFIFADGLVAIAASAIAASYKWKSLKWSATAGTNDMICTIIESSVALMVACVPGVYGLWSRNIIANRLHSRLSSTFSQMFSAMSKRSRSAQTETEGPSKKSLPSAGSMEPLHMTVPANSYARLSEEV